MNCIVSSNLDDALANTFFSTDPNHFRFDPSINRFKHSWNCCNKCFRTFALYSNCKNCEINDCLPDAKPSHFLNKKNLFDYRFTKI